MIGVSLGFFDVFTAGALDFFLSIATWNKGIEMLSVTEYKWENLANKSKLTLGPAPTFSIEGWFELVETTFDLVPEKRKYIRWSWASKAK
jgi:hypothetical protein